MVNAGEDMRHPEGEITAQHIGQRGFAGHLAGSRQADLVLALGGGEKHFMAASILAICRSVGDAKTGEMHMRAGNIEKPMIADPQRRCLAETDIARLHFEIALLRRCAGEAGGLAAGLIVLLKHKPRIEMSAQGFVNRGGGGDVGQQRGIAQANGEADA